MNRQIIIGGLILLGTSAFAQDAKEILKKSFDKCQSMRNGYYEMTKYMKYMSRKDTVVSSYSCTFKKLNDDTLFSSAFHYHQFFKGAYSGDVIYTGNEFITTNAKDISGIIMSTAQWSKNIKS